jgi:hypothetical protein
MPIKSVEVKSAKAPSFVPPSRGTDGTLTDASGFGEGSFHAACHRDRRPGDHRYAAADFSGSVIDSSAQFE